LPFATVLLHRAGSSDTSVVAHVQTGENGQFEFTRVLLGSYTFRTSALGFEELRQPLTLSAAAPVAALGALLLAAAATRLGEVLLFLPIR
jgi:hypothetical protein